MVFIDIVLSHAVIFFFLMIRRPPRSTQSRSSAASDVYKRQLKFSSNWWDCSTVILRMRQECSLVVHVHAQSCLQYSCPHRAPKSFSLLYLHTSSSVSYTHLRAHETVLDLVCRLLLEKKKKKIQKKERV
eukprot:TRINITY_DN3162_c0_g1_i4.p1 TRINITY_DN3162_c0_g1~~TRINITY_DN3162_c0_g1_i4.p1  ORF type:complete len:130 (-),score=38.90 TRINITY_DN3162_c0_g1_i4:49-438(-)